MLTYSHKAEDLRRSLIAGAKAFLLKEAEPEEVLDAIREVFAGNYALPPEAAAILARSIAYPQLSAREIQVLAQIALGKRDKEIGGFLYVSEHTVRNHVKAILKKLRAASRTEAVSIACERGLIEIG
jgi:two-component system, NarL family, response regulator